MQMSKCSDPFGKLRAGSSPPRAPQDDGRGAVNAPLQNLREGRALPYEKLLRIHRKERDGSATRKIKQILRCAQDHVLRAPSPGAGQAFRSRVWTAGRGLSSNSTARPFANERFRRATMRLRMPSPAATATAHISGFWKTHCCSEAMEKM
jgi:hypothetical protein